MEKLCHANQTAQGTLITETLSLSCLRRADHVPHADLTTHAHTFPCKAQCKGRTWWGGPVMAASQVVCSPSLFAIFFTFCYILIHWQQQSVKKYQRDSNNKLGSLIKSLYQ